MATQRTNMDFCKEENEEGSSEPHLDATKSRSLASVSPLAMKSDLLSTLSHGERDPSDSQQTAVMATSEPFPYSLLMNALDDLGDYAFQRFKLYLGDRALLREFGVIKRDKLETEEKTKILRAMMDFYGIFTIEVMKIVLAAVDHNLSVEELRQYPFNPNEIIKKCTNNMESCLIKKCRLLSEGVPDSSENMDFKEGYIEVFITEGSSGLISEEHEVRQMERHLRKSAQERTVLCQHIFNGLTKDLEPIRVVLTKGVAGVGKTVLTQKFTLDWAEGRANKDIQLLFPFTFRELNVLRGSEYSLVGLLHHFFRETENLINFQCLQVLFIFDGLDECRLPLDFRHTRVVTDSTESVPVEVLLVNLIRRYLLPSARIWITTRPAAATLIPAEYVSMVTEVRGFTGSQKEQYFRKRIKDEQQATAVVTHINKSRSLNIMCHIPIFCWILLTVLLHLMNLKETVRLPQTLTQMYARFLVVQAQIKNVKYEGGDETDDPWTCQTKKMVLSLGRLAFEQLQKGNLIFYNSDLRDCGLDTADMACYSGVFTEVFREEPGRGKHKVYSFIHLTVQEFLAALHVHHTFFSFKENLLSPPRSSHSSNVFYRSAIDQALQSPTLKRAKFDSYSDLSDSDSESERPEEAFYRSAVDRALQSPNGHLDLFLRFLLGLSVSANQRLLHGLLAKTGSNWTNQRTAAYIKKKLNVKGVSAERNLNLLHCLNELNDSSLLEEIQKIMREGGLANKNMSPAEWSALSFLLLSTDTSLDQFDLRKYCASEEALLGLLLVVKACTKVTLSGCGLSSGCCGSLASVFSSSSLNHLELSNNDLQDSGVELLCDGLKSTPCTLGTLKLSGCLITKRGGAYLAATLSSAPLNLINLDLRYNHLGTSTELLNPFLAPQGPLQSLRMEPTGECWMVSGLRKYACEFSLDPNTAHRDLQLSEDRRSVAAVKEELKYPDHEDRFTYWWQVLSATGLSTRCYWEVDWSVEWEGVDIAVSYRGIQRKGGRECAFGYNDQSWNLEIQKGGVCTVRHNKKETRLPCRVGVSSEEEVRSSGRVGVFLDWEGGALSFYDIVAGGRLCHMFTYNNTFTEELFPGLRLYDGSSVSVVDLNISKQGPRQV